jgi:hypothetical protein
LNLNSSGTGVEFLTSQRIIRGVNPTGSKGRRRQNSIVEERGQREDRISDIHQSIIVGITCIHTVDESAIEQAIQRSHGISNIE